MVAAQRLLKGTLPTAVVCANDRLGAGVLDALRRAGVDVPGEVSITGYDDSMLARLGHIDLTTVSQKPQEQADHAVAAVVERLDKDRTEARSSVLTPDLVVRATTAPPH
jgi:LacI family transcriptional regulator